MRGRGPVGPTRLEAMYVGVLRLTLHIPHARSLKERRKVVRSFKDRVSARLRASVAEVGGLDQYQRAVLGVAVVSNDPARVDEILSSAASMAGTLRDAVLTDRAMEIIPFGDEGQGLGVMQGDRLPGDVLGPEVEP